MPLAPGTQLGRYQITALIGTGGMGEVYRALDPQVSREVAIKVSAAQFSERFEREARAVAALNHPNICTLFDVGPNYLVMEFVEGPTLAERVKEGALSLDDSFAIARQMAGALEHAHEKGIIHRDLKPANVKVRSDGMVKVLDFGLAKHTAPSGERQGTEAPTLTIGATQPGSILGTPAYMSPEQAKGLPADKRADIWAFGVVLHEMLTGKRTYSGETISEVLAHVILKDPDWEQVPKRAERLLRWCLEKDPGKRLRDIGDATRLMDEKPEPVAGTEVPVQAKARATPWMAVAGVMTAAAGIAIWAPWRTPPPEAPLRTTTLLPPDGAAFDFGQSALPAISPDGKRVVFGARPKDGKGQAQLWVRQLDSPSAQPLPGTEQGFMPFWDPASRYVAFASPTDRKLKKIDVQGGPPVALADLTTGVRGGSWSPQGVILIGLATTGTGAVMRVPAAGGTLTAATTVEEGKDTGGNRSPWFLPDGRHFLYTAPQASGPNPVRVGSLDDPQKPGKVVAQAESNAVYSQGNLLYLRGSTLMAQPFDPDRLQTTAEAVPIAEHIPTYNTTLRIAAFSVSTNGLLVYSTGGSSGGESRLTWTDRSGKALTAVGDPVETFNDIELSPDQKSLLGGVRGGSAGIDLWIFDMARGLKTRFTFEGNNPGGIWSPDGSTVVYPSVRNGKSALYRKAANGTGVEETLYSDAHNDYATSWSQDGKELVFATEGGGPTKADIFILPVTPEKPGSPLKPKAFLQTPFNEDWPRFSPDGKWIAYNSDDSGRAEVFVAPYPGPGGKRQVSTGGGRMARWRRDSRELFYLTRTGDLMAAEVSVRNGSFEVGRVQKLFGGLNPNRGYPYDVSLDGQKFIVAQEGSPESAAATPPLTLVENWLGLIKK